MSLTRFLIEKRDAFQELAPRGAETDNFNSHFPTLNNYRRMVEAWRALPNRFGSRDGLTRDQILKILEAASGQKPGS